MATAQLLRPDHADVWLAWPDAVDAATLASSRALLSPDERALHDRFRFEHDRVLYTVAHALVRRALSRYAVVSPADWRFISGPHGRPLIAPGLPRIAFNLSHARGICACIIAGAQAVGVDVEEVRPNVDVFELAAQSFASVEVASLHAIAAASDNAAVCDRFYSLWTLKESYIKARGLGLSVPLGQFAFSLDGARIALAIDPALADDARRWWFALFAAGPNHRLAAAVARAAGMTPTIALHIDPLNHEAAPATLHPLAQTV